MLTAEIICVGTELLMGQVVNTNAAYISERLTEAGIGVIYSSVVGDNPERLKDAVDRAIERCDVVVTTGGLGPTDDDLTKETIAELMGKKLVFHPESMDRMTAYFRDRGKSISKNNEKQAYIPEGAAVIENDNGTAPGCIIDDKGKTVVMLPGPPKEMKPMMEKALIFLKKKSKTVMSSRVLRLFGIGESSAAEKIADIIENQTNPTIAPYAKEGEVTFRITASSEKKEQADELLKEMADKVYERLGEYIYGEGDDNSLSNVVVKKLCQNNLKLATAESCTGGLIGQMITKIPGASECYEFGFITYANRAKEELLGVRRDTIEKFGAVSEEAAGEMAEGARRAAKSDIAVSVTGIAGPGGGSDEKPVGLAYIGVSDKNGTEVFRFVQSGDRERVRVKSALCALDIVNRRIGALI